MSKVIEIKLEQVDGQSVLVKKYASSTKKRKTPRKMRGHQTSDMNLVYQWHRSYPKHGA